MRRPSRPLPYGLIVGVLVNAGAASVLFAQRATLAGGGPVDSLLLRSFEWRNIGPMRGGRSQAAVGSTSRPLEYYFGAVGGGLWKTTDGGVTWHPVTDGKIHSSSVGAVAVAESNPDVVYVGMGETELRGNIMQGDGVYKSADAGKTWTHCGLEQTQAIARVRVDRHNPDVVFVAALGHPFGPNPDRGVFRSADGCKTWQKVLFRNDSTGAVDLVIDPSNSSVLFAALWDANRSSWGMKSGGPGSGLFKSTDGGSTWQEITRAAGLPAGIVGKIGVSVSGADPSRVYAIIEAEDGGVFRSDDGGGTWTRVNDDRKLRQRAFYYSRIYADPVIKDRVYVLNVGFYRSDDAGKTFPTQVRVPHGDNHDLWIAPNDDKRMVESNDGGGTVSVNAGESWTPQAYPTAQSYHVALTTDVPYHVCGAQQDNSTFCVPSERDPRAAGDWLYTVGGGESGYIAPDPLNPNIFYAGSQGALLTRYDRSTGHIRDVQVYPRFFSGEPASSLPERWQWTYPIVFSPLDPRTIYTSSQHLWRTVDQGQTWRRISPDLTRADPKTLGESGGPITHDMNGPEIYATIFSIAPSQSEANTVWTGSDDGLVFLTRDGGATWKDVTPPGLPPFSRVSLIDASPHDAGTAYVAAKRYQLDDRAPYLYRTHDFGRTWTKIVDGIAAQDYTHAIREDPRKPGLLYAGAEHGVYISFDDGGHWQSLALNLPDLQVSDLVVADHDLVVATHGRSMWILNDIDPLRQMTTTTAGAGLRVFQPHDVRRSVEQAVIQYALPDSADKVTVEILNANGKLVRAFTAPATRPRGNPDDEENPFRPRERPPTTRKGLNRFAWDLRYPGATVFEGMVLWSANAATGPVAPPGHYQVRVTANGASATKSFDVVKDPRLKMVTDADLRAQFDLAMKVRDRVTAANEAVITIRNLGKAMTDRVTAAAAPEVTTAADALRTKLAEIEEAVYQVRNRSGQDPLNFPIKLNNRIAALGRSVETGDARPTAAAYVVFKELSAELDRQLRLLNDAITTDLSAFNKLLASRNLAPVRPAISE